jgi:hypothetical protein
MRVNKIRALHGYRTRHYAAGKPSALVPNLVKRNFDVSRPNKVWVTDITYIRTWEGWLYLAIVMDLFSRKIVGGQPGLLSTASWSSTPSCWRSNDGGRVELLFTLTRAVSTVATTGAASAEPIGSSPA